MRLVETIDTVVHPSANPLNIEFDLVDGWSHVTQDAWHIVRSPTPADDSCTASAAHRRLNQADHPITSAVLRRTCRSFEDRIGHRTGDYDPYNHMSLCMCVAMERAGRARPWNETVDHVDEGRCDSSDAPGGVAMTVLLANYGGTPHLLVMGWEDEWGCRFSHDLKRNTATVMVCLEATYELRVMLEGSDPAGTVNPQERSRLVDYLGTSQKISGASDSAVSDTASAARNPSMIAHCDSNTEV